MILVDFECQNKKCGHITEELCDAERQEITCPKCRKKAKRIISVGHMFVDDENAPWIRSVLDVVDKDSTKPHVQEFMRNPTRENYKKWMKGEGIRPLDHNEHGAPPVFRKPEVDLSGVHKEVFRKFQERHRLEVR